MKRLVDLLFIAPLGPLLLVGACIAPSKSLGAGESGGESTSDDATSAEGSATGDDTSGPPTLDWCAVNLDEGSCNGAPQRENGPSDVQFCQWIEVYELTIADPAVACSVTGPTPRCLTIQMEFNAGCGEFLCGLGPQSIPLNSPQARSVPGDFFQHFEVFGVNDVFCGGGNPVGDWVSADDESLGACALTCGVQNACDQPFEEYVVQVSSPSEDAPVDDCGVVTLADPIEVWQAAHDCALQHAAAGEGMRLIAEAQSIDSSVHHAFVGLQAESYAVVRLFSDSGGIDPVRLDSYLGDGLTATADCVVAVGELCLSVTNEGEGAQICPA